ncbi:MAG TPA: helix-hairpin-helix domain-containing protein [Kofleriaceae bacterium]|nr:helix-hairpin-helix domain-containing protein [Kofleriaceae bacterium]
MTNARIAATFEQVAALLEQQRAEPHRARAWRDGAQAIREHPREMSDVFHDHGRVGLEAIPHIGPRLANVIIEMIKTGRTAALDRLRGDGVAILESVPGLGHELATRIHHELGIESLEELEAAAHDGRLARVPGFGPRRIAAVCDVLSSRLARTRPPARIDRDRPDVALLLDIDREYRRAAEAGELAKIAPKRFNPRHEAWLPVMHVDRDGWSFTALYSNTALAHDRGRIHDWVILYGHRPHEPELQQTVVTEWRGRLRGQRVVRGRERECEDYYADLERHALRPAS